VVSKTVTGLAGRSDEVFHCLAQPDYIAILAITPGGLIPIIRQYRPAVEVESWELPAGLMDPGESPEAACRRELQEETGLNVTSILTAGSYDADPGRMENRLHAFVVAASEPDPRFTGETGQAVEFVTAQALYEAARSGKIRYLHHVGVIAMAVAQGLLPVSTERG
jgi:ADP-ribose pyrophosphatase